MPPNQPAAPVHVSPYGELHCALSQPKKGQLCIKQDLNSKAPCPNFEREGSTSLTEVYRPRIGAALVLSKPLAAIDSQHHDGAGHIFRSQLSALREKRISVGQRGWSHQWAPGAAVSQIKLCRMAPPFSSFVYLLLPAHSSLDIEPFGNSKQDARM